VSTESILPYVAGRCQFLGQDHLRTVYDHRPASCRSFECVTYFNAEAMNSRGEFLRRNPAVLMLAGEMRPPTADQEEMQRDD